MEPFGLNPQPTSTFINRVQTVGNGYHHIQLTPNTAIMAMAVGWRETVGVHTQITTCVEYSEVSKSLHSYAHINMPMSNIKL